MKRSKFSEEQVAYALRQAESGTAVGDVCRQVGISEATGKYTGKRRHTGRAEQKLSAVTNVATRRASSVESARRTASLGFLDSTRSWVNLVLWDEFLAFEGETQRRPSV